MNTAPVVYETAKTYVNAACDLLSSRWPQAATKKIVGMPQWVPHSETAFIVRETEFPFWYQALGSGIEMHSIPEYAPYLDALRRDPIASRYLGATVTTERGGGRTVQPEEVADRLIWLMAERRRDFGFNESDFNELFGQFDAEMARREIEFFIVGPLPGFKSQSVPFHLDENCVIDRLTDEELSNCLRSSIRPGVDLGGGIVHHLIGRCGVRQRVSVEKLFGESPRGAAQSGPSTEELLNKFRNILHALRVFKKGRVSLPGVIEFSLQWPMGTLIGRPLDPSSSRDNSYELSQTEADEFVTFWRAFESARRVRFLDTAIRRFGYAGERHRPEDRLVDLLIAAEALFLSDAGETKERGELRFRLSLRFAFFVRIEGWSRIDKFRLMRSAYDARSALVHGSEIEGEALKLPIVGRVSLLKFVDGVEEALRVALHQAIETRPLGNSQLVDWDILTFGES